MHVQVLRCLNIRYAPILDQAHRLKLELPGKLTPLHDPPPAPSKHLTQCLRNRVQANAMSDTRKVTVEVSKKDLENAQALTGLGVTQTVRAALRKLASVRAAKRPVSKNFRN